MYVDHLRLRRSFAFCRVWGSDEEHDLHVHDLLEIGVLLDKQLTYRFGDRTYEGRPGDVFLCRPFEPHWSYARAGETFASILVLFTPSAVRSMPDGSRLLLPFYDKEGVPPLIPADTPYAKAIRAAAEQAMAAQEQAEPAWATRQYMHLIGILLQVGEFADSIRPLKPGPDSAGSPDIADTIGFLLERYRDPLDSEALLRQAGVGKSKFYEEFRQLTGISPNEFINRLRVQNAMDLLRSSSMPVIEIAEASGFQSLSACNKQFKRYTGLPPREYRKRMRSR